jgi:hypothetical protein
LANEPQARASHPNLWELLEEQRELLGTTEPTDDSPNTPFNPEEQRQIAAQLDEIKELLVSNHGVDPAALDDKLDYLVDASKRTGRVDWRNIFVATIFGLVADHLITPETWRVVMTLAAQGIGHLFGGGMPQLPVA